MSSFLDDWKSLDAMHKQFVFRVLESNGRKHGAMPSSYLVEPMTPEHSASIALWEDAERLGFVKCTGSYKWVVTSKFYQLAAQMEQQCTTTELKKQLAAKPEADEKVDGVKMYFSPYNQTVSHSRAQLKSYGWTDGQVDVLKVDHASAPASATCQSCAAKDAEIAALNESRTCVANECSAMNDVIETLKKAAHADWVKSDRTGVELYNAKLDLEKLQSKIETQRENSADTQRNLERAREIIGQHETSILRVTAELTAALGGGV